MTADDLRKEIRKLVGQYAEAQFAPKPFVPGETMIPPAGKVIGEGAASSFDQLSSLMSKALADGGYGLGAQRTRREVLRGLRRGPSVGRKPVCKCVCLHLPWALVFGCPADGGVCTANSAWSTANRHFAAASM